MGMIADELERALMPLQALGLQKQPFIVEGHRFTVTSFGGAVQGVQILDTTILNMQIQEIVKALATVAKAVRKLEDERKPAQPKGW